MQMFVAVGWRDGMKYSALMRDLKSLFWTLILEQAYAANISEHLPSNERYITTSGTKSPTLFEH